MKKKSTRLYLILLISTTLLFACGKKLPEEWKSLEGTWQNAEVTMTITANGGFNYKRISPGEKVSIDSWISDYSDKGFTASIIVSKIDFVVNKKPFFNDSLKSTQMILDGRLLTKKENW